MGTSTMQNRISETAPATAHAHRRWLGLPAMAWGVAVVAAGLTSVCAMLVGVNPGMFFAGLVLVSLLPPALCLTQERFLDRLFVAWSANDGVGMVWVVAVFLSPLTLEQWFMCYLILLAWTMTLAGLALLLSAMRSRLCRVDPDIPDGRIVIAPAVVIWLAMLWLSCPIWLARAMPNHQELTHWLTWIHPLLASNSVVRDLGLWTERPIAYRYLLTLGQDLPAGMPQTAFPAIVFHMLLGLAALGLSRVIGRR